MGKTLDAMCESIAQTISLCRLVRFAAKTNSAQRANARRKTVGAGGGVPKSALSEATRNPLSICGDLHGYSVPPIHKSVVVISQSMRSRARLAQSAQILRCLWTRLALHVTSFKL